MEQREFVIDESVLRTTIEELAGLPQDYEEAIRHIREETEQLLSSENWKGKARDEFKATFRIVDHYLSDDLQYVSDIREVLEEFINLYKSIDVESAEKFIGNIEEINKVLESK